MRLKIIFCKHTWQTEVLANFQKPSKEERKQTQCIVSEIILKYWLSKVSNLLLDLSNVTNWTNSFFLQKNLPHLIIAEEVTEVGIISALQIGNRKKKKKSKRPGLKEFCLFQKGSLCHRQWSWNTKWTTFPVLPIMFESIPQNLVHQQQNISLFLISCLYILLLNWIWNSRTT